MTTEEFKRLRKLANAMRRKIKQIDECGEWNTTQEVYSLREFDELASEAKSLAWDIYDRGFK